MTDLFVTNQLDEGTWRRFLERPETSANIYHTPEMARALGRAQGHRAAAWAALDGGRVLALFVPVDVTLMPGPMRILTSRAVAYGGIATAGSPRDGEAIAALVVAYAASPRRGVLFTELRHIGDPAGLLGPLQAAGFRHEEHLNYLIPLQDGDPWDRLSRSARRNVRIAERKEVAVEETASRDTVEEVYVLLEEAYRRARVPLASRSLFDAVVAELAPRGMIRILTARLDGRVIAARLLLLHRDRVLDWYAGSDRRFTACSPNELLVWRSLQWAREHGYTVFDFGGAGRPDQPYGPREFKARFGGTQVNFGRDVLVHSPMRLRLSRSGYEAARRLRRGPSPRADDAAARTAPNP